MKNYKAFLEASEYFIDFDKNDIKAKERNCFFLASFFISWISLESYINTLCDILSKSRRLKPHERAFLKEKEIKVDEEGNLKEATIRPSTTKKILYIVNYFSKINVKQFKQGKLWINLKSFEDSRNKIIHHKENRPISIPFKKSEEAFYLVKDVIEFLNKKVFKKRT